MFYLRVWRFIHATRVARFHLLRQTTLHHHFFIPRNIESESREAIRTYPSCPYFSVCGTVMRSYSAIPPSDFDRLRQASNFDTTARKNHAPSIATPLSNSPYLLHLPVVVQLYCTIKNTDQSLMHATVIKIRWISSQPCMSHKHVGVFGWQSSAQSR